MSQLWVESRGTDTKLPDIYVFTYKIQDGMGSASFMRLRENQEAAFCSWI